MAEASRRGRNPAEEFAYEVIEWIRSQAFFTRNQAPNYVVGITEGGNLIISKVGGVTETSEGMEDLQGMIAGTQWFSDRTPRVYLAQKFTHDGNNNHAEMCALAAADALTDPLRYILCTADNCSPCYLTLASAHVRTDNDQAQGRQQGWAHPRGRMQLGTGLAAPWEQQMAELERYNACEDKEHFNHEFTQQTFSTPKGSCRQLL